MRISTLGMIGVSAAFGLIAVFIAQGWLNQQAELRLKNMQKPEKPVATRTVVVAASALRFGNHLSQSNLREVEWPGEAIPSGTFATVSDALAHGKRTVLAAIAPNEPILKTKVTGPGEKATLSALLQPGMKAVTIRVNDVDGVAGFILPGDHVDVLMTRQQEKSTSNTEVVLQRVKVLAIDQSADQASEKPSVAKAVTLEVDTIAAQKLSLAGSIGSLSLALRKAGETEINDTRQITISDLSQIEEQPRFAVTKQFATVTVTRAGKTQEYSVRAEEKAPPVRPAGSGASSAISTLKDTVQAWGTR